MHIQDNVSVTVIDKWGNLSFSQNLVDLEVSHNVTQSFTTDIKNFKNVSSRVTQCFTHIVDV